METNTPEQYYQPSVEPTWVFRDVLKYVHGNNDLNSNGGTLLNRSSFQTIYPFVSFDLSKQKLDIKDGTTKLTFKYEFSGTTSKPTYVPSTKISLQYRRSKKH